MSNENDRSKHNWDDEYEEETPRTFREDYLNTTDPYRPRSRSRETSYDDMAETPDRSGNRKRPRGAPGGGRIYEASDDRPSRPRPTRQSREEVYARLRQRPRQPIYSRDQEETRPRSQSQAKQQERSTARREPVDDNPYQPVPRRSQGGEYTDRRPPTPRASARAASTASARSNQRANEQYDEYDEYNEYDEYEIVQENRRQYPRKRRGKSVLSTLLIGCLGGLLTLIVVAAVAIFLVLHNTPLGSSLGIGKSAYTQQSQQTLALGNATQLIVKGQVGNVSITVDQNASSASVTGVKRVQASSQSDANNQFKQITLVSKQISQGADPSCTASSCLLITTTVPTAAGNGGGLLGDGNGDSLDLTITLPASFNSPNPLAPYTINASSQAGNITINGFNGILNLNGNAGNIGISHALIYAGTCIQTTHGNITVAQGSFFDLNQPSNLVPCTSTNSTGAHPWFNIRSGVGNVDITLLANSTNVLLDANTNNGKISDDFGRDIPSGSDGSATYHGPLLPDTNPTASLYVATSTGNITLSKQQS